MSAGFKAVHHMCIYIYVYISIYDGEAQEVRKSCHSMFLLDGVGSLVSVGSICLMGP